MSLHYLGKHEPGNCVSSVMPCLKSVTALVCYIFNYYQPILIIFGSDYLRSLCCQWLLNLSCPFTITSLTCCEFMKAEITHFWCYRSFANMPVTKEDKILIKNLFTLECYNAKRVSQQRWNVGLVYKLLQKLRVTGLVDHRPSSSRWCSSCTADSIDLVYEVVLHTKMSRQEAIFTHCT